MLRLTGVGVVLMPKIMSSFIPIFLFFNPDSFSFADEIVFTALFKRETFEGEGEGVDVYRADKL